MIPQHIVNLMDPKDRELLGKAGRTTEEVHEEVKRRLERDLHKQLCSFLNLLNIPFCHARMDRKSSITVGWPDFSFAFKGRFVAWEAKTMSTLSPEQNSIKTALEKHGALYKVITRLFDAQEHLRSIE